MQYHYVGIWYTLESEVKRDYCMARDIREAESLFYSMYTTPPAPMLSIVLEDSAYER